MYFDCDTKLCQQVIPFSSDDKRSQGEEEYSCYRRQRSALFFQDEGSFLGTRESSTLSWYEPDNRCSDTSKSEGIYEKFSTVIRNFVKRLKIRASEICRANKWSSTHYR